MGVDEADRFIAEGHFLEDGGDPGAALERYRESAAIAPEHPRAYLNIGNALRKLERGDEASAAYRHALRIAPHYVQARFNLAGLLAEQGDFATALTELTKALCDDPGLDSARILFADMLEATGRVDLAERELREAMKTGSEPGGAALNLGHLLLRANRFVEAEECMLQARSLDPVRCADALSSYCFALNLRGDLPAEAIFRSHQRIGSVLATEARAPIHAFPNVRDPKRRIRIGYVSSDFRHHPVGLFMRPVLGMHDRETVEVHCYSSASISDDAARDLQRRAEHWHDVTHFSDSEICELVRSHQIDVLVDLGGHTDRTRLGVFARRAAPVQVTWLGYLNTTGLPTMDYRLCDWHAEPQGTADQLHVEALCRLPNSQWCYEPWFEVQTIAIPHSERPESLVFGSFNQFQKITDQTLDIWCRVLRALPDSQLVVLDVRDGRSRRLLLEKLSQRGVDARRVATQGRLSIDRYFQTIGNVDIALDTFPYNGATTTFDALWMGLPIVALCGERGVARSTFSILSSLALPELVAQTPNDYVDINVRVGRDAEKRRSLRSELRDRLRASPLMNASEFCADLESTYRTMWRNWCSQP